MISDVNKSIDLFKELESVFTDYYANLYSYAYRMIGNHQDAEDVLQNAFVKATKNIEKFRGESKLTTWVFRIVVNESYDYFEHTKKLPILRITEKLGISENEFFESIPYTPNMEDNLIIEEMREKCLQGFLRCVPKNQRVCFLLKSVLNLTNQDIADILGTSVNNVKVTLHRGRKKLQEMFEMRCSLIDPEKPCKCHLWIKYMNDHNLPLPTGYNQFKSADLRREHFSNLSTLYKIHYLYTVESKLSKEEFIKKLKIVADIL